MQSESVAWRPSQLVSAFNQTLDFAYGQVEVEGEVSSYKINQGKYVFFDIKDESASLNCFAMIYNIRTVIFDGMKVKILARPKITDKGKFSLTVDSITPVGEGDIKKARDLLREKLSAEGLFADSRKRELPYLPERIGIISSKEAAGFKDFMRILDERWAGVEIILKQVQVQGVGSADQMVEALDYFNQLDNSPEVIAIIRGGGSLEDLMSFDDERLVRAVASSRIPVLSGVGHEVDVSLVDLASDKRAATPTHAAQILFPDRSDFIKSLDLRIKSTNQIINQRIDNLISELRSNEVRIEQLARMSIERLKDIIQSKLVNLEHLNPKNVLKRGYAIVTGKLSLGQLINIETKSKIIEAEVKDVQPKKDY